MGFTERLHFDMPSCVTATGGSRPVWPSASDSAGLGRSQTARGRVHGRPGVVDRTLAGGTEGRTLKAARSVADTGGMRGGAERPLAGAASIGELNERSLHRALKARYAVAGGATEQAVDGFVADVVAGGRIVEVHTGSFRPLKRKLPRLLERYPVTLVHPVARDRYIVKMAADPNAPPTRRKSPKRGSVFEVFPALASIPALLAHPNLTLEGRDDGR